MTVLIEGKGRRRGNSFPLRKKEIPSLGRGAGERDNIRPQSLSSKAEAHFGNFELGI
jgi:hypothetical protein